MYGVSRFYIILQTMSQFHPFLSSYTQTLTRKCSDIRTLTHGWHTSRISSPFTTFPYYYNFPVLQAENVSLVLKLVCTLLFQQLYSARYQISKETYIHIPEVDAYFRCLLWKFFEDFLTGLKKSADGFGIHSVYARTPARVPPRMIKYPGQYAHLARIPPRRINYPGHPEGRVSRSLKNSTCTIFSSSNIPHAPFFPPK